MASDLSIPGESGGGLLDRLPQAVRRNLRPRPREAAEREALLRVAAGAAAANDLEGMLEMAAEEALRAIGAAALTISRFEDEGSRYRVLINVGEIGAGEQRLPRDEIYEVAQYPGLLAMYRTSNPTFNSVDDPACNPTSRDYLLSVGKSSDLEVAIIVEGQVWGGIWAATAARSSFEAADVRFLEAIGGQIATAITRVELFSRVSRLAYEDALTGLANRRAFEERLERALARRADGESAVALMLCDADGLKEINDAHGHAGGDAALRNVATALVSAAAAHPGSFVARLGGDEFCVLVESLERVAEGVELGAVEEIAASAQRELGGLGPYLTLSCGVATATPQTATASLLLAAADTAQYVAKRRGGNRICTAAQVVDAPDPFAVTQPAEAVPAERLIGAMRRITDALSGEMAGASALNRLERVGSTLIEAADLAACAISLAATGADHCRELSHSDNRGTGGGGVKVVRTWEEFELYRLDAYPETARIIEAGSGTFIARVGDETTDPHERAMLEKERFKGVVGAAVGGEEGVYLLELFSDDADADLRALEPALALGVAAAMPPQPHSPGGRSASAEERALGLTTALASRLAEATAVHEVCEIAAEELQRAFECTIVHLLESDGAMLELRAGRGAIDVPPGWSQSTEAGLIGRCLREGAPVLATDVTREPQYRNIPARRDVRSELAVPIFEGERIWGALNLEDVAAGAFGPDDARVLEAVAAQLGGALASISLYQQLDRAYVGTAEALSAALEAKDSYTAEHSESIAENAVAVARLLGWRGEELRMLRYAAAFHDIGKLGISPGIINKPGPLSPEEREEMSRHTLIGERILAPIEFLVPVRPLVRHAHERWDGTGYPDRLAGEEIPLGARIIFACDAYDAMTTDRAYRAALPDHEARQELRRAAGSQFDPVVVDALLTVLEEVPEGSSDPGRAPLRAAQPPAERLLDAH